MLLKIRNFPMRVGIFRPLASYASCAAQRTPLSAALRQCLVAALAHTAVTAISDQPVMESTTNNEVSDDPALAPFVTATEAEIAYAEELLRQIELRYLNRPAEPRIVSDVNAD